MFTGIVELVTPIRHIDDSSGHSLRRLAISPPWDDVRHGESIAVNGVCLTVARIEPNAIFFEVVAETLEKTNLGRLEVNESVNLERSLKVGDRLDGHFVQGHVDGIAVVRDLQREDDDVRIAADVPPHLAKYLVEKGSVCLDGVSLTLAGVHGHRLEVALIPTTLSMTTLGGVEAGWPLNLEVDMMTKTIVTTLERLRFPIQD